MTDKLVALQQRMIKIKHTQQTIHEYMNEVRISGGQLDVVDLLTYCKKNLTEIDDECVQLMREVETAS